MKLLTTEFAETLTAEDAARVLHSALASRTLTGQTKPLDKKTAGQVGTVLVTVSGEIEIRANVANTYLWVDHLARGAGAVVSAKLTEKIVRSNGDYETTIEFYDETGAPVIAFEVDSDMADWGQGRPGLTISHYDYDETSILECTECEGRTNLAGKPVDAEGAIDYGQSSCAIGGGWRHDADCTTCGRIRCDLSC